jgi:hypothetical protein
MDAPHPATASSVHRLAAKLPALVQQEITMQCSGQGKDEVYSARVLSLPRNLAGNGYLRESTPVVVNFVIGKTLYEARGNYCADDRHIREVVIDGDIAPTSRRLYDRTTLQIQATVVPVSNLRLSRGQFAELSWKRCRTLDISAGGALVQIPFQSPTRAHFLLNLDVPGFDGPLFIFAQVQWGNTCDYDRTQYLCGLNFIVREDLEKHFSKRAVTELPDLMLNFDSKKQEELDAFLKEHAGDSKQGDKDDRQQDER